MLAFGQIRTVKHAYYGPSAQGEAVVQERLEATGSEVLSVETIRSAA